MSDEELRAYHAALKRVVESGGFTAEEDRPILECAERFYEEVKDELPTVPHRRGLALKPSDSPYLQARYF